MYRKPYDELTDVDELMVYYGDLITEANNKRGRSIQDETLPVVYADLKRTDNICIFDHIIIFTNSKDPKNNKTLKNILDAIKAVNHKPELHLFFSDKVSYDENDNGSEITIDDGQDKFTIKEANNTNTLVFSRLSVNGEMECEQVVKVLQDRGFLVLNPVRPMQIASNKYDSACLFERGNIPQPRFSLMTKKILYDKEQFDEAMAAVNPKWDPDNEDNNEKLDFVIKILDGHGGTGVNLSNGKAMIPWLQTIFAIDPERQLIIQSKEDGDGGDLRVHVLTLRDRQVILGAMKRVQLSGDFRSNVSLGATAEPVKLSKEQEQIALRVANISKMPWCAVDIMHLKNGGDVVLEMNSSPGTAGISEVLKTNFVNILLNELSNPSEFLLQDKAAGFVESAAIQFNDHLTKKYLAKLDTGNSTTCNTLEVGEYEDNDDVISFKVDGKTLRYKKERTMYAIAGDKTYKRPVITVPRLTLGNRAIINVPIAVVHSRGNKTTNLLMNRDTISKLGYIVSPGCSHILTPEMDKIKIL